MRPPIRPSLAGSPMEATPPCHGHKDQRHHQHTDQTNKYVADPFQLGSPFLEHQTDDNAEYQADENATPQGYVQPVSADPSGLGWRRRGIAHRFVPLRWRSESAAPYSRAQLRDKPMQEQASGHRGLVPLVQRPRHEDEGTDGRNIEGRDEHHGLGQGRTAVHVIAEILA